MMTLRGRGWFFLEMMGLLFVDVWGPSINVLTSKLMFRSSRHHPNRNSTTFSTVGTATGSTFQEDLMRLIGPDSSLDKINKAGAASSSRGSTPVKAKRESAQLSLLKSRSREKIAGLAAAAAAGGGDAGSTSFSSSTTLTPDTSAGSSAGSSSSYHTARPATIISANNSSSNNSSSLNVSAQSFNGGGGGAPPALNRSPSAANVNSASSISLQSKIKEM